MDIAKYIGQFLLKNNYCYLHGLGNLELKKKPARYDGDALHAPEFDVVLTPGGSIDDTLANYIATYEQTSISKAANALREFSTATKAEIAAGKEVEIPAIGKFLEQNGQVRFISNPDLKHVPPPVPMLRMSKRLEETPDFKRETTSEYGPDENSRNTPWGKFLLFGLLAAGLIAALFLGIRYFNATSPATQLDTVVAQAVVTQPTASVVSDTINRAEDTLAPKPVGVLPAGTFTVVLNTYPTRGAADKRAGVLTKNGNQVEVVDLDTSTFFVVMRIAAPPSDTLRVLDSLRRFFNPKGVRILR